jgi:DNA-directed RNA polymerase specialized sigma24 family protein
MIDHHDSAQVMGCSMARVKYRLHLQKKVLEKELEKGIL